MSGGTLPAELDVVALLSDVPEKGLVRGQVGTVIEVLDATTTLIEFADDRGRAFAILPCDASKLLVLHYQPEAA